MNLNCIVRKLNLNLVKPDCVEVLDIEDTYYPLSSGTLLPFDDGCGPTPTQK